MNWKWEDFSSFDRLKMEKEISADLVEGDLVNISSNLNAFLELNYPLNEKPKMKQQLYKGLSKRSIPRENNRELANILYTLGELGINWTELPEVVTNHFYSGIEACVSDFIPQQIATLIYG
jgi:hypothetical protein